MGGQSNSTTLTRSKQRIHSFGTIWKGAFHRLPHERDKSDPSIEGGTMNAYAFGKKDYRRWLWLVVLSLLALQTLPTLAQNSGNSDDHSRPSRRDDDDDKKSATPPGLYITPTALPHADQQLLNPGLTN